MPVDEGDDDVLHVDVLVKLGTCPEEGVQRLQVELVGEHLEDVCQNLTKLHPIGQMDHITEQNFRPGWRHRGPVHKTPGQLAAQSYPVPSAADGFYSGLQGGASGLSHFVTFYIKFKLSFNLKHGQNSLAAIRG